MSQDDNSEISTVPFDPRFPNANQTLACFTNYIDYHRCMDALDGDAKCEVLKKFFTTICPNEWIAKWDDQRQAGNFPHPVVRVPKDYCEQMKAKKGKGCKK